MIVQGDARHIPLADETVQCCVTSPPYWGLRDYGLATWEGGDVECSHDVGGQVQDNKAPDAIESGVRPGAGNICRKCGAVRHDAGIGLEPTPEEYVANIVQVFREVRRVLRDDGTLWLNLGDCYASIGHKKSNSGYGTTGLAGGKPQTHSILRHENNGPRLKHKDLVGIPWRVAFALQADGWYLRSDIIWAKPNPMPESVTDRPTKSHEYMFLLSKNARYFYDAEAVREPNAPSSAVRGEIENRSHGNSEESTRNGSGAYRVGSAINGRNRRDVWFIATQPYKGAHFATFPEALVEPCILAGSSPKACGVCGAPWERVIDVDYTEAGKGNNNMARKGADFEGTGSARPYETRKLRNTTTRGWRPACDHNDDTGRCIVLDPFCGTGTVGKVCRLHDRRFVGIDLSREYLDDMAMARGDGLTSQSIIDQLPLFGGMK